MSDPLCQSSVKALLDRLLQGDSVSSLPYLTRIATNIVADYGPGLADVLDKGDIQTLYIAPAVTEVGSRCRVYALSCPLKEGQNVKVLLQQQPSLAKEIGLLADNNSRLVYLDPAYADAAEDIVGQGAGTTMTYVSQSARARRDEKPATPVSRPRPV